MKRLDLTDAVWVKSSRSNGQSACVEVAFIGTGVVPVRDSKESHGPVLVTSDAAWSTFVKHLKH
jgi:hypothetical protein